MCHCNVGVIMLTSCAQVNYKLMLEMLPEEVRGPVKCVVRNVNEGGKETFAMDVYNRKIRCEHPDFGVVHGESATS